MNENIMKANRPHTAPTTIEVLGDNTYYYNYNAELTVITDEDGLTTDNYNYEQIRCVMPVNILLIQEALNTAGSTHVADIRQ